MLANACAGAAATRAEPGSLAEQHRPAVQRVLDSIMLTARAPGVSIGVAFADGSSLGVAGGWADTTRRIRLTPEHRLLQGSVGKTYVSAAALQLAGEGKLDLDAPISRWLGNEPWFDRLPNARSITVRQLMNHTSGLVRYEFNPAFLRDLTADPYRTWTPEQQLAYLFDTEAKFAAGEGWDYSDTNYIVLGLILERITGRAWYEELQRRFLDPLALGETVPQAGPVIPGLAQGYAGANNEFGKRPEMLDSTGRMIIDPRFEWTGGGVVSTTRDLARWGQALYGGGVLDSTAKAALLQGVPAPLGAAGTQYGLGVIIRPTPAGVTWGHSGFFPGYSTDMMYFPEDRVAVAVQLNTSDGPQMLPRPGQAILAIIRALRAERTAAGSR